MRDPKTPLLAALSYLVNINEYNQGLLLLGTTDELGLFGSTDQHSSQTHHIQVHENAMPVKYILTNELLAFFIYKFVYE